MSILKFAARVVGLRKLAKGPERDAAQVVELQAQVQDGKNTISVLEARIATLSVALEKAEADAADAAVLREKVRNRDSIIVSPAMPVTVPLVLGRREANTTNTGALQAQEQTRELVMTSTDAEVTRLSVALEKAEADASRLSALWKDAQGKDRVIISLDELQVLQGEGRRKGEIISKLETKVSSLKMTVFSLEATVSSLRTTAVSLSIALESAEQEIQLRSPACPDCSQCESCTPPDYISTAMARGKWLRRQAEILNDEASKILFDALNPEFVGPQATLYNDMRVDLHLQYRAHAVGYVKNYITFARDQGLDRIIFIVGRGLHSHDNVSKLRPIVLDALNSLGLEAYSPQYNTGEIVVKLQEMAD
ncbi:hypothetical protein PENSPDRAFT_694110 [Peniophora sp. CONT]|nr:hypothetical protein PENSPDRAFT_694110 [Peniophora sp. CONT]